MRASFPSQKVSESVWAFHVVKQTRGGGVFGFHTQPRWVPGAGSHLLPSRRAYEPSVVAKGLINHVLPDSPAEVALFSLILD